MLPRKISNILSSLSSEELKAMEKVMGYSILQPKEEKTDSFMPQTVEKYPMSDFCKKRVVELMSKLPQERHKEYAEYYGFPYTNKECSHAR